jgi:hypothetical protein
MRVVTYGFGMRSEMRRLGAAAAVVAAVLCLGACAPEDPGPKPSPDPTSTPLFASDEEALAAAEEAYGRYLLAVDEVLQSGGNRTEILRTVSSSSALENAEKDAADFSASGLHTAGNTTINSIRLQSDDSGASGIVYVYVCEDVAGVDLLDSSGLSVVNPERSTLTSFDVAMAYSPVESNLIVDERSLWTGESVCV